MLIHCETLIAVFVAVLTFSVCQSQEYYPYVSSIVKEKFGEALKDAWKLDDIATLHYAVKTYSVLNIRIPISDQDICSALKKVVAETNSVEALYHITAIAQDVTACASSQLFSDAGKKVLMAKDQGNLSVEDLFFIISSLKSINDKVGDVSSILKQVKTLLRSNETLSNLAFAFHIANVFEITEAQLLFNKFNSLLAKVDLIDNKYYQFEGGLTLTAFMIEGIYKLSEYLNKVPPLKNDQLVKFLNYFLSRLCVSRPRSIFSLIQVLDVLTNNNFHSFVTVDMVTDTPIIKANPTIQIRVSNIFGEPLLKDSAPTVMFVSGKKSNGEAVNVKSTLKQSPDKVIFTISATELNLTPDMYTFKVSVTGGKKVIVNSDQHEVEFKVSYRARVENFELGVLDSEQSSTANLKKVPYQSSLKEKLIVDSQQRLQLKFSLKDLDFGLAHKVHQAFVLLINRKSGKEATFVCSVDSNKNYKLSIDLLMAKNSLENLVGDFDLVVVIGDVLLAESIKWTVANVQFKNFGEEEEAVKEETNYYEPKPEIKHLFREPERRPPPVVSTVFTGLVLTPLLLLLILWMKLGVSVNNFPFSLSAIGFHGGLASIFLLFITFWMQLNMFQTLKYLMVLGSITFLCGNKMLRAIAAKRKGK